MNRQWQHELDVAIEAASAAAEILRARPDDAEVREKGRADLVTIVDERSERLIAERLGAAFPDDVIIGEEFSATVTAKGRRWFVDPVDGTVNYVHRHPFTCVSIALVDDEGPAVGVIHAPFLGEVYTGTRGGGAYLNGEPISVSGVQEYSAALIATGFPFRKGKGDPAAYLDLVEEVVVSTHGVRRAGSAALDLAFVASGRVDGYFELGLGSWDVAAGMLLVLEAGGRCSGWGSPDPLASGSLIASNGLIHPALEEVTGRHLANIRRRGNG